jgi:hypothetical protein
MDADGKLRFDDESIGIMPAQPLTAPASLAADRRASAASPFAVLILVSLALGLVDRVRLGWNMPLWLDETFTGVIATQPDLRSFIDWCLAELSGPVYYAVIWIWEKVAGSGDIALRLPSLAFAIAAPLLILWKGHADLRTRQLWAALVALWIPGLRFASEARPYALLFLLACAQAIAFLRLLRSPGLRPALIWCGVSALMVLTHYHALLLAALQGLAYLAIKRGVALRTWPAALLFVPVAAWMGFHLPFLLSFMDPAVAWYRKLNLDDLAGLPGLLLGTTWPAACLLLLVCATFAVQGWRAFTARASWPYAAADTALVATGVLATLGLLAIGFLRPSFVGRYLIPFMPAILFGIALWARGLEARYRFAGFGLVAISIVLTSIAMSAWSANPSADMRSVYNFEEPSAWLRSRGVERLVFLWDNPTAAISRPERLAQVGGFFFDREGAHVPVTVPVLGPDADPNTALLAAAEGNRTGILWAYDIEVPRSRGIVHPARIASLDPRWACRDFGRSPISVIACVKSPAG